MTEQHIPVMPDVEAVAKGAPVRVAQLESVRVAAPGVVFLDAKDAGWRSRPHTHPVRHLPAVPVMQVPSRTVSLFTGEHEDGCSYEEYPEAQAVILALCDRVLRLEAAYEEMRVKLENLR